MPIKKPISLVQGHSQRNSSHLVSVSKYIHVNRNIVFMELPDDSWSFV
jgi:hypothetical protein